MKRADVCALLGVAKAAYPRMEVSVPTEALWCELLADLDGDAAAAALKRHIATSPHPPTVADLRRLAAPQLPSAAAAWAEVLEKARGIGRERAWSHAAIGRAVEGVGWEAIRYSEQVGVERAHFLRVYAEEASRADEQARMPEALRGADRPRLGSVTAGAAVARGRWLEDAPVRGGKDGLE